MSIGLVVKFKVKAGKNADFEKALKEAQAGVRREEHGCVYYDLYTLVDDPQTYVMLEQYRDDAAVAQHRTTKHFEAMMGALQGTMDGPPDVQSLKLVSALRS